MPISLYYLPTNLDKSVAESPLNCSVLKLFSTKTQCICGHICDVSNLFTKFCGPGTSPTGYGPGGVDLQFRTCPFGRPPNFRKREEMLHSSMQIHCVLVQFNLIKHVRGTPCHKILYLLQIRSDHSLYKYKFSGEWGVYWIGPGRRALMGRGSERGAESLIGVSQGGLEAGPFFLGAASKE